MLSRTTSATPAQYSPCRNATFGALTTRPLAQGSIGPTVAVQGKQSARLLQIAGQEMSAAAVRDKHARKKSPSVKTATQAALVAKAEDAACRVTPALTWAVKSLQQQPSL